MRVTPCTCIRYAALLITLLRHVLQCQAASVETPQPADGTPDDKVATVCAALRAAMQAAGQRRYLGPILTSHAKQGDLEAALAIVQQLKEQDLAAAQAQRHENTAYPATAEKAPSANGVTGRVDCHGDGHADADPMDTAEPEAEFAAGVSPVAPGDDAAVGALHGEDDATNVPERHRSWTAEDGLRHLLLYSDVDKLYRCWALRPNCQCSAAVRYVTCAGLPCQSGHCCQRQRSGKRVSLE